ncbi:MAG: acyltransferase [Bacteroidota bacterium]|nr:acyltransferase [Bacteroidota bacterium]
MEKIIHGTDNPGRCRQLDSLRGLAALTVFFGHFLGVKATILSVPVINSTPLITFFNGNAAVMFFFVLSGFVLSLPFIDDKRPLKLTGFYLKRVFRIYPALIFAIVFSVILKQFIFNKAGMAPFSGWLQSFWTWPWNKENFMELVKTILLIGPQFKKSLIDPPIWSLIIEMNISLFLPFLIRVAAKENLPCNLLFLVLVTTCSCRGDYWPLPIFLMGVLLAKYRHQIVLKVSGWKPIYTGAILLLALLFYNNTLEFLKPILAWPWPYKFIWSNYTIAIGSVIIIATALASKNTAKFFEHRIFIFFGDISYSFYLIHMPLLITMASLFSYHTALSMVFIFVSTLGLAIAISYLMFIFVEKPCRAIAAKWVVKYKILNRV